jgi:mannose-6-phosphate isomerase
VRSANLYPLTFEPVYKRYTWGGRKLESLLGRTIPSGPVAESWEISAHPQGPTRVVDGPLAGRTLGEVQDELGALLLGSRNSEAVASGRFPLLVKLLDANEWLSVQVHPSDEYALARASDQGKTEMWLVLEAEEEAEIILGFKAEVDRERFVRAIDDNRIVDLLHRNPARRDDVFFVPPGTIHAIGPGNFLVEIQQTSNVTYRVYDWDRPPSKESPRPLHLTEALEVLDFGLGEVGALEPRQIGGDGSTRELLVRCPYFSTERLELEPGASYPGLCDGTTFEIWAVLSGRVLLESATGALDRSVVSWFLLPASLGSFTVRAEETSTLLRVTTPG